MDEPFGFRDGKSEAHEKVKQAVLLEEDITKLEEELTDKYYQLGKSIYELSDRKVAEINQLVDRLVETKIRLSNTKNSGICVYCMAENPKLNTYCGKCGKKLEITN